MKKWTMKAENKKAEIYLYSDIGYDFWEGTSTAETFAKDLKALGDVSNIELHINSNGGDVFDGQAIHSLLKNHKAYVTCYVDGLAASIASVIAMSADKILMPKNAMMMIHNAWTGIYGNSKELRKMADDLDIINDTIVTTYINKSNIPECEIRELMDNETWLNADRCLELGLCDEVLEPMKAAASISKEQAKNFRNVPKELIETQKEFKTKKAKAYLKLLEV